MRSMTISNLRCDVCDVLIPGLIAGPDSGAARGVRFTYHPGDPGMRDDSGVLCGQCWESWARRLGAHRTRVCATCGTAVRRTTSLHLRRTDSRDTWQLCTPHAAELLNTLNTVDPKLDPTTFQLPLAQPEPRSADV
ncbi:MAG: hypothetical protein NVSMB60_28840 [Mycobacterium sp.]